MKKQIKVKLVHSPICCTAGQRATIKGLGLRRLYGTRTLEDSACVRGMIKKIPHLVTVVEEGGASKSKTRKEKVAHEAK